MTLAPAPFAESIADLHERLGQSLDRCGMPLSPDPNVNRDPRAELFRRLTIDAVVRPVSPAPTDVNHENVARIGADWNETDRLIEAARVDHGFCTPAYRKAVRAIIAREPAAPPADMWTHRGWKISYDCKPIPCRDFDWEAVHPDYDASYEGPEDGWVSNGLAVQAGSYKELLAEIDMAQDDYEEANGQFGVGA